MILLRTVKKNDLSALLALAQSSTLGLTSLPQDPKTLAEKIDRSIRSIHDAQFSLEKAYYLFVMEDLQSQKILGCSAIKAQLGIDQPYYAYHIRECTKVAKDIGIRNAFKMLFLSHDYQHCSELGSLFLASNCRGQQLGKTLSLGRFLFMAQHPTRFAETIIAELRGAVDENNHSPFWRSLGKHFFEVDFGTADRWSGSGKKQFIADLMPQYPIYVSLLTPEAQQVIGQAYANTKPAQKLLAKEGFIFNNYVDIFDAGPIVEAQKNSIQTIANSQITTIEQIVPDIKKTSIALQSNTLLDFRLCAAPLQLTATGAIISQQSAEALQLAVGEQLRYCWIC